MRLRRDAFASSEAIFREFGDDLHLATVWQGMAFVAGNQGEYAREQQLWERILPVFRAHGDPWKSAMPYMGWAMHFRPRATLSRLRGF